MLGTLGLIAISPELGNEEKNTATFFIEKAEDLKKVLT